MSRLQVFAGYLPDPRKDDDRHLVLDLSGLEGEGPLVLAVADGISRSHGAIASEWVINVLRSVATQLGASVSIDALYSGLLERLVDANALPPSSTTLSCGVLRPTLDRPDMVFEFFALGDSPIYKVVSSRLPDFRCQAFCVYSEPKPGIQAAVSSCLSTGPGRMDGPPYFGSVRLSEGEMLLVVTDGVPMDTLVWDDQVDPDPRSPLLLGRLFDGRLEEGEPATDDSPVTSVLRAYDRANLLVSDDATLVAVRFGQPASMQAASPDLGVVPEPASAAVDEPAHDDWIGQPLPPPPQVGTRQVARLLDPEVNQHQAQGMGTDATAAQVEASEVATPATVETVLEPVPAPRKRTRKSAPGSRALASAPTRRPRKEK